MHWTDPDASDRAGGRVAGASAVIYGLVAMGMVWAPRNDINCIVFIGWRAFYFEMPVVAFASIYFLFEVISTVLSGLAFGSSMLHLLGAACGFVLASLMLKLDWVDCEGWDLYTTGGSGKSRPRAGKAKSRKPADGAGAMEARSADALAGLRRGDRRRRGGRGTGRLPGPRTHARGLRPLEPDLMKLIAAPA